MSAHTPALEAASRDLEADVYAPVRVRVVDEAPSSRHCVLKTFKFDPNPLKVETSRASRARSAVEKRRAEV